MALSGVRRPLILLLFLFFSSFAFSSLSAFPAALLLTSFSVFACPRGAVPLQLEVQEVFSVHEHLLVSLQQAAGVWA